MDLAEAQDVLATLAVGIHSTNMTLYTYMVEAMDKPLKIGSVRFDGFEMPDANAEDQINEDQNDEHQDEEHQDEEHQNDDRGDAGVESTNNDEKLNDQDGKKAKKSKKSNKDKSEEKSPEKSKRKGKAPKDTCKTASLHEYSGPDSQSGEEMGRSSRKKSKSKRSAPYDSKTASKDASKSKKKTKKAKRNHSEELGEPQVDQADADIGNVDTIEVRDGQNLTPSSSKACSILQPQPNQQGEKSISEAKRKNIHLAGHSTQSTAHKDNQTSDSTTSSQGTQGSTETPNQQSRDAITSQSKKPATGMKRTNASAPDWDVNRPFKKAKSSSNSQEHQKAHKKNSIVIDLIDTPSPAAKAATKFAANLSLRPQTRYATPGSWSTRAASGRQFGAGTSPMGQGHCDPLVMGDSVESIGRSQAIPATPDQRAQTTQPGSRSPVDHGKSQNHGGSDDNLSLPRQQTPKNIAGVFPKHDLMTLSRSDYHGLHPGEPTTPACLPGPASQPLAQWTPSGERQFKCRWCKEWFKHSNNVPGKCRQQHQGKTNSSTPFPNQFVGRIGLPVVFGQVKKFRSLQRKWRPPEIQFPNTAR